MSSGQSLESLNLVFTGEVDGFTRTEIRDLVGEHGVITPKKITNNTDYLIRGNTYSDSSKPQKAREQGIPILSEAGFYIRFGDILAQEPSQDGSVSAEFEEALTTYQQAKSEKDWDHPVGTLIKRRLPDQLEDTFDSSQLQYTGSIGKGRFANIPWIGVFDERVTTTPTQGLYVVYLFDVDSNDLYLTLNQGMTDLKENHGIRQAREILSERAEILRSAISVDEFTAGETPLSESLTTGRNRFYKPATVCYKKYSTGEFPPDEEMEDDLEQLIEKYQSLVEQDAYHKIEQAFDSEAGTQHTPEDFDDTTGETDPDSETQSSQGSSWLVTRPAESWHTTLQHGAIPFVCRKEQLDTVAPGDYVFFNAVESDLEEIDIGKSGVFGYGRFGSIKQNTGDWWWKEKVGDVDYNSIITVNEAYLSYDPKDLKLETSTIELGADGLRAELQKLLDETVSVDQFVTSDDPTDYPAGIRRIDRKETPENVLTADDDIDLTETILSDGMVGQLDPATKPDQAEAIIAQLQGSGQIVFHGPPGTGKTYTAHRFARWWLTDTESEPTADQVRAVTFHPSFAYEDFMEGLTAKEGTEGQVAYQIENGVFKNICVDARKAYLQATFHDEQPPKYVLIIDEINRGKLAKIFGETITQLEQDKRLGADNEVTVTLAHSGEQFTVPPNLFVIGTMNTADRSIALVDAALRRRFSFHGFPPNYEQLYAHYEFESQAAVRKAARSSTRSYRSLVALSILSLEALNKRILDTNDLGKGKQIGHSYLFDTDSKTDVVRAWQYNILPLLEEYYFDDLDRLQKELFEADSVALYDTNQQTVAAIDNETLETALSKYLRRVGVLGATPVE